MIPISMTSTRVSRFFSEAHLLRAAKVSLLNLTLAIFALICVAGSASADLVSPYGGETAPNFVEIAVHNDRVRVALEIDPADYPYFVGPDDGSDKSLSQRTGEPFQVQADGVALKPSIRVVDLRSRQPRVTAATAVVPPRPRSDEVIYAELNFAFEGRPQRFTFTPPLDGKGMALASIGLLVEHLNVPVTDYRYLSRAEVLIPDWEDPWFSVFENPNLTRHHKSPLMSFLSMEPREVRHEIIVRLRDIEEWVELGLEDTDAIGMSQMDVIEPAVAGFLSDRNPVVINGEAVSPVRIEVSRVAVGVGGLSVLEDTEQADRGTALLGIILSYPRDRLAEEVEMTWELFPEGVDSVPVTLTDPAGGVPAVVRVDDRSVRWTNHLTAWKDPKTKPVEVSTASVIDLPLFTICLGLASLAIAMVAVRSNGKHRRVASLGAVAAVAASLATLAATTPVTLPGKSAPNAETARVLMSELLENAGTALLETETEGFSNALAPFVATERAKDVGFELRRGLSVTLPSGALARTDEIVDLEVERITPSPDGTEAQILASWSASVSGGHWGHLHRRIVTYRGIVDVSRQHDRWFMNGLTILTARTDA